VCTESTVIEFGTPREVLFSSTLPLEFADRLRLENSDGTLNAEASVVALQYTSGRTAVAARFTQEVFQLDRETMTLKPKTQTWPRSGAKRACSILCTVPWGANL